MIVITGAAGFIPSCLVSKLNQEGYYELVLVDDFSKTEKKKNYEGKRFRTLVERTEFGSWLDQNYEHVEFIFHLGARTDTTEFDKEIFDRLNLNYSKMIWKKCVDYAIPLVYASSAATYGLGEFGYDDKHELIPTLKPLNPYGDSKNDFDKWAIQQNKSPMFWAGLQFFNIYGPNEYHKGRMASVIWHAYNQIKKTNKMKLFESHNPKFENGGQMRDFVYVKDVVEVLFFLMKHRKNSGIYNLGSGEARTFKDLTVATFKVMNVEPNIEFVPTPIDIRDKYQYYTQANMSKLKSIGYSKDFYTLEQGVADYVENYLKEGNYY